MFCYHELITLLYHIYFNASNVKGTKYWKEVDLFNLPEITHNINYDVSIDKKFEQHETAFLDTLSNLA